MKQPSRYIRELCPVVNAPKESEVWLPSIHPVLEEKLQDDDIIVIGHDWFAQGCYEKTIVYFNEDDEITDLREHPSSVLLNDEEDLYFELGTMDHKGLAGIHLPHDKTFPPYFHLDMSFYDNQAILSFNYDADTAFITKAVDTVLSTYLYCSEKENEREVEIIIRKSDIFITYAQYKQILKEAKESGKKIILV